LQGTNIATVHHADEASADSLKRLCEERKSALHIEKLDIRNLGGIQEFVGRVATRFGGIDYLINNVGAGTAPEEVRIPVESIPIGRRVEIDEGVEAVMYFLSDAAASTTGQFIGVNGGLST